MQITDEMVEPAARAMYERDVAATTHPGLAIPWNEAHPANRDYWREMAREALRVARLLQVPVHLCDTCAQSMCRRRRDIEDACEDPLFPAKAVIVECKAYVANERAGEAETPCK